MFQISMVFLLFGLIYRFEKKDIWTSFRIGAVGPLISLFSFEDILYYPMHGENPFNISSWSWLPQHNIYFGRPVTTSELIIIVSIAIAVFPVCLSPIINSLCPLPMGIIESIGLIPVCKGSFTG